MMWAKLGKKWANEIYLLSKNKDIKLLRSSPSFNKCDICNKELEDNTLIFMRDTEGGFKIVRCPYCLYQS